MTKQDKTKFFWGLENLRSVNLPLTEIRPITILVGQNNLGKSSVLQTFPLIKQSIDNPTIEPINWKGGLVDFGNYETTVRDGNKKNGITFRFAIENFPIQSNALINCSKVLGIDTEGKISYRGKIIFEVHIIPHKNRIIRRITNVELPDHKVKLEVISNIENTSNKVNINGIAVPSAFKNYLFGYPEAHIFSEIVPIHKGEIEDSVPEASEFEKIYIRNIEKILKSNIEEKVSARELRVESLNILAQPCLDKTSLKELEKKACSQLFRKLYGDLRQNTGKPSKLLREIGSYCGLFTSIHAFNQISQFFGKLLERSLYFKPTRAISERSIINENLKSFQISPDGRNLTNFFDSIKSKGLKDFSKWLDNYFNFGISISNGKDHSSLIVESNGKKRNIADSGFGISEVLPLLAQIWWTTYQREEFPSVSSALYNKSLSRHFKQLETYSVISIEQPESHLHPKRQEILADIFVDSIMSQSVRKDETRIKPIYLIETHSASIINRLGELVELKKELADQIQILVFSAKNDKEPDSIDIQEAYFDENGYLHNWPYKFLR